MENNKSFNDNNLFNILMMKYFMCRLFLFSIKSFANIDNKKFISKNFIYNLWPGICIFNLRKLFFFFLFFLFIVKCSFVSLNNILKYKQLICFPSQTKDCPDLHKNWKKEEFAKISTKCKFSLNLTYFIVYDILRLKFVNRMKSLANFSELLKFIEICKANETQ